MKRNLKKLVFALSFSIFFALPVFGADFVGSKAGYRYHYPQCPVAKTIKPSNLLRFKSPEEARKKGYVPCSRCNPPVAGAVKTPVAKKAAPEVKKGTSEAMVRRAEELCSEGKVLALEKKCAEALPYFDRAIREDPNHVDAWFQSGVCKSELGRHREAISAFNKVITMDPSHGAAYYSLGVLYANIKRYEAAIDAYRQAIRLKPDDGSAYYNLGVVYATMERYEDAAAAFREAVRIRPDLSLAYNNLGVCYSNLKQYPEAAEAFRQAIRLKPDDAFANYNMGVISIGLGQYKEAIESLSTVTRMRPDDETVRYHLGVACFRAGYKRSSQDQYQFLLSRKSPLAAKLYEEIHKE